MWGKIVHSFLLNFPKFQKKNLVKATRLKTCRFYQNYQDTFMERVLRSPSKINIDH